MQVLIFMNIVTILVYLSLVFHFCTGLDYPVTLGTFMRYHDYLLLH